jgi:hypothetical protein
VISAWTKGGNVPNATVRLQAVPDSLTPDFSFGCGSNDGTASCDLGAIDAKSAERQLEAKATVPATASTVKSVRLIVIGSAANLPKDPKAAATVAITKPAASKSTPTPTPTTTPITSSLPVGSLPAVSTANPTTGASLSPGGNAAGLFPTLKPSPSANSSSGSGTPLNAKARQAADTSALPESAPVVGAQLAGLAALLVAFVLAVTRFSIRRRPAPATGAAAGASPAGPTGEAPAAKGTDSKPSDAAPKAPESAGTAEPAAAAHNSADPSDEHESAAPETGSDKSDPDKRESDA